MCVWILTISIRSTVYIHDVIVFDIDARTTNIFRIKVWPGRHESLLIKIYHRFITLPLNFIILLLLSIYITQSLNRCFLLFHSCDHVDCDVGVTFFFIISFALRQILLWHWVLHFHNCIWRYALEFEWSWWLAKNIDTLFILALLWLSLIINCQNFWRLPLIFVDRWKKAVVALAFVWSGY